MKPIKIMIIIPTLGVGGAETMVETLVMGLIDRATVILVLYSFSDSPIEKRILQSNVKVLSLNKPIGFSIKGLYELHKIIKDEDPAVIHTHLHALPYAWVAGGKKPIIHTVHSVADKEQRGLGKIICKYIYKYSKRCTPVALTQLIMDSLEKDLSVNPERIEIINNGVQLEKYKRKDDYSIHGRINLIHVGRFFDVKNHFLMIECINDLKITFPNIHLSFLGDGELRNRIVTMIQERSLESYISLEGVRENVSDYLADSDIFLLPSKYEGMPMSLIEAMGCGLPIIATNIGGIPNVIKNEVEGLLITPSLEELRSAICRLVEDCELRRMLGNAAYKKSKEYSSSQMCDSYYALYLKVMKK